MVDDGGNILELGVAVKNDTETEFYKGIICPGFINTHCHLELSHLRGKITERSGMTGFIRELLSIRPDFSNEEIQAGIAAGEREMIRNGIVAVGDISNDNSTFMQKSQGNLLYHTFIEVFDLDPSKAEKVFNAALSLKEQLEQLQNFHTLLPASIVPHAPYTVSNNLFSFITKESSKQDSLLSIHNQESKGESELFESHSGPMFDAFSKMGVDLSYFPPTGMNSLRSVLDKLPPDKKLLLVHNTFTSKEDIQWTKSQRSHLFWCTCPNANMFIEGQLPDYSAFIEENCKVTIGTDSLASNWSLSVLDELKTISKNDPSIPLPTLLQWATLNGAEFLGRTELGTIEKGKRPGLNLLTNIDGLKIDQCTEVIKLI
jgi:cytosine/adenosine deaminase-related metal-dependent hydrolase